MGKTKIVRYTEEQFITLLENIVNKVKEEQKLVESNKRDERKQKLVEKFDRIREEKRKQNPRKRS